MDHEYFIPTKFHQNPSSGSGEEVENVNVYRRMDDGRSAMTIAHLSLWLRWAKNMDALGGNNNNNITITKSN